jgi:hypothetical protein
MSGTTTTRAKSKTVKRPEKASQKTVAAKAARTKKSPAAGTKSPKVTKPASAKKLHANSGVNKSVRGTVAKKAKAELRSKKTATKSKKSTSTEALSAKNHTVHDIPSLHQPAAPRIKHISKPVVGEFWMWVAFFFTFLFIYSVAENVLNASAGADDSLSLYSFLPAVLIALGVWRANRTKSTYTGMVIVLSMLSAGLFIWLFGLTSASSLLFS